MSRTLSPSDNTEPLSERDENKQKAKPSSQKTKAARKRVSESNHTEKNSARNFLSVITHHTDRHGRTTFFVVCCVWLLRSTTDNDDDDDDKFSHEIFRNLLCSRTVIPLCYLTITNSTERGWGWTNSAEPRQVYHLQGIFEQLLLSWMGI